MSVFRLVLDRRRWWWIVGGDFQDNNDYKSGGSEGREKLVNIISNFKECFVKRGARENMGGGRPC